MRPGSTRRRGSRASRRELAIIDALDSPASGADRQAATLQRETALKLAGDTLLRVRHFYCSATRDVDATPELVRIGYAEPPPAAENVTEIRIYSGGSLVATVTSLPMEIDGFTVGDSVTLFARYFNAAGESDPSDPGTATAG